VIAAQRNGKGSAQILAHGQDRAGMNGGSTGAKGQTRTESPDAQ